MTTDHPCKRQANVIGVDTICISTGTDGEFDYWLAVTSQGPGEPQLVTLNVRPQIMPD